MGTQPGLLELFLSLKHQKQDTIQKDGNMKEGHFVVDSNSCLHSILDMIDPAQQV